MRFCMWVSPVVDMLCPVELSLLSCCFVCCVMLSVVLPLCCVALFVVDMLWVLYCLLFRLSLRCPRILYLPVQCPRMSRVCVVCNNVIVTELARNNVIVTELVRRNVIVMLLWVVC